MHDEETHRKALEWLNTSPKVRVLRFKTQICEELGISVVTLDKWDKERRNGKGKVDKVIDQLADLSDDEIDRFKRQVYTRAMEGGASAKHMELFAKLQGMLIEKSVRVNIGFGAEEIAKIRTEARRELESKDFSIVGSGKVRPEPPLLSQDIREDKG